MDQGPDIEAHHHPRTGRAWVDVMLSVSAVTISLISLLLAIGNGDAMQRLVAANSWPFVSIGVGNRDEHGDKVLRLIAQNKGIGPAKVQTLEVFYNGRPVPDAHALIRAILGPAADGGRIPFGGGSVVGDVLSSKEVVLLLAVQDKGIAPADLDKLAFEARNIGFRTCYCSVFDECWVSDRTGPLSPPTPVKSCPAPKVPFGL
jgi:hypothetical protein